MASVGRNDAAPQEHFWSLWCGREAGGDNRAYGKETLVWRRLLRVAQLRLGPLILVGLRPQIQLWKSLVEALGLFPDFPSVERGRHMFETQGCRLCCVPRTDCLRLRRSHTPTLFIAGLVKRNMSRVGDPTPKQTL